MQDMMHIGVIKVVNTMNNIDIPSIPNLNLMKSILISKKIKVGKLHLNKI